MIEPFSVYHSNVIREILRGNLLVVIGYGFRDRYLNMIINTYLLTKGKRMVIVSPSVPWEALEKLPTDDGIIYSDPVITWFNCGFKEACERGLLEKIIASLPPSPRSPLSILPPASPSPL